MRTLNFYSIKKQIQYQHSLYKNTAKEKFFNKRSEQEVVQKNKGDDFLGTIRQKIKIILIN